MGAKNLSAIKPQLDAANVRLVGVGVEEFGLDEFVKGKYWDGELYIDQKKASFKGLNLKVMGYLATAGVVVSKKLRAENKKASDMGITGNIKGDSFQNGGTIVVDKGGKVLFEYRQLDPSDEVDRNGILKALNLKPLEESAAASEGAADGSPKKKVECNEDVCEMKKD